MRRMRPRRSIRESTSRGGRGETAQFGVLQQSAGIVATARGGVFAIVVHLARRPVPLFLDKDRRAGRAGRWGMTLRGRPGPSPQPLGARMRMRMQGRMHAAFNASAGTSGGAVPCGGNAPRRGRRLVATA